QLVTVSPGERQRAGAPGPGEREEQRIRDNGGEVPRRDQRRDRRTGNAAGREREIELGQIAGRWAQIVKRSVGHQTRREEYGNTRSTRKEPALVTCLRKL